jgi:hypothetical protein
VVVIEELTAARTVDAVTLWHEVGLTRPWNDPVADLERALSGPASTVLAATDGGELVGTAVTSGPSPPERTSAHQEAAHLLGRSCRASATWGPR